MAKAFLFGGWQSARNAVEAEKEKGKLIEYVSSTQQNNIWCVPLIQMCSNSTICRPHTKCWVLLTKDQSVKTTTKLAISFKIPAKYKVWTKPAMWHGNSINKLKFATTVNIHLDTLNEKSVTKIFLKIIRN